MFEDAMAGAIMQFKAVIAMVISYVYPVYFTVDKPKNFKSIVLSVQLARCSRHHRHLPKCQKFMWLIQMSPSGLMRTSWMKEMGRNHQKKGWKIPCLTSTISPSCHDQPLHPGPVNQRMNQSACCRLFAVGVTPPSLIPPIWTVLQCLTGQVRLPVNIIS